MAFNLDKDSPGAQVRNAMPGGVPGMTYGKAIGHGYRDGSGKAPVLSDLREHRADDGALYRYRVADGAYVQLTSVECQCDRLALAEAIEGLPVLELGADLLAENEVVREVTCPPQVRAIGAGAFRLCPDLRKLVLPRALDAFQASWLRHSDGLEHLILPGGLEKLTRAAFDFPNLRILELGPQVREVEAGAAEKSTLEQLVLDPGNPYLDCDGVGLYAKGFRELLALVRPVTAYEVHPSCEAIGRKAAKGHGELRELRLPQGLIEVSPYGLAHTGLRSLDVPATVRRLGERCLFHCEDLRSVRLHEGLEAIDEAAFAESGLEQLAIPGSVSQMGTSIVENAPVVLSGPEATFAIAEDSPWFEFDGKGGVYRREDDGLHLVQLMDRGLESYEVDGRCVAIDPYAVAFHPRIAEVRIPQGVAVIGDSAFRVCPRLRSVSIPGTARRIGKEAFLDTVLESIMLPAGLQELGPDALVTSGAHHGSERRTLGRIEVEPGNGRFYVESGILCERREGGDRALMFDDSVADVVMPENVVEVASYAFNNAENVRSLSLGERLRTISHCGFTFWSKITSLDIALAEPLEGRSRFSIGFPDIDRARHDLQVALGGSSWVNVPEIYRHYDNCLINAHDYTSGEGLSPAEQARRVLERLDDPIFLTPVNESMLRRTVSLNLMAMCKDAGRHDDRALLASLADHGFLDGESIEEAIMAVQPLQDASITGYLLELKRTLFGKRSFDFDL